MRTFIAVFLFLALLVAPAIAENHESTYPYPVDEIPPGMEVISGDNGFRIIAPIGARTKKVGAQIIIEGTKEYVARVIDEMRKELIAVHAELDESRKQLGVVNEELKTIKKDVKRMGAVLQKQKEEIK